MEWLNYHHLLYFWTVAKEGGLKPAAQKLRLAHPTLSGQIHALEDAIGQKLFVRVGRRLTLTDAGRTAYRYAEEIFGLGQEMLDALHDRPTGQPLRLQVGAADVLPKLVVRQLLEPALHLGEPVRLVVREDKPERLLAALSLHEVDVVLSDAPAPPGPVRAYSHLLRESAVAFYATPKLARALRPGFPRSLDGARLLLPTDNTSLRRSLDHWLERQRLRPEIVAEFDDSALMKTFGADGQGVFPAPVLIADAVVSQFGVEQVGSVEAVRERYYALSVERRLSHPAVVAVSEPTKA